MDGDDDDDDFDSDEDWDEMDDSDDDSRTLIDCLFCKNKFPKMEAAVSHCYKSHGLDLPKLKVGSTGVYTAIFYVAIEICFTH